MTGRTRIAGVFGYPVKHSASPAMHNAAFDALGMDWAYAPFEVAPENLRAALSGVRAMGMAGVNVTVPLKELVAPHLDSLSPRARLLGAVNTVVNTDGHLAGDTTDGPGFAAALVHAGVFVGPETNAVVLGAGGSARAVVHALLEAGAAVTIANRSAARAEEISRQFAFLRQIKTVSLTPEAIGSALAEATLLVNTTSVGMHPNEKDMPPVPENALHPGIFVCDLIYNPGETRLLGLARGHGCGVQNGVEMLVRQGALAFSQWTGIPDPPVEIMREAVLKVIEKSRIG